MAHRHNSKRNRQSRNAKAHRASGRSDRAGGGQMRHRRILPHPEACDTRCHHEYGMATLALAICHCWRAPMIARMAEAEAKVAEQRKKFAAKVKAAR